MWLVLAAERAVLAQLKPVGVVAPVLPRDVVAVLALLAGQGDLGPDVGRSHVARLSTRPIMGSRQGSGLVRQRSGKTGSRRYSVAEAGLEPATQRL